MARPMHLLGFMLHSPINHTVMSWTHPRDKVGYDFAGPEIWQDIARILEHGRFDGIFLADVLAAHDAYQGSDAAAVKYGVLFPCHDPVVLVPVMSAVTQRLGFTVTLSTTYYHPYLAVRKFSTLDHLTRGRIGWNIVTSYHKNEAQNFGLNDIIPHDERYDWADEHLEVCNKLWQSWEPDAVVMDRENGIFADPTKVHRIHHKGKYFECIGPSCVSPSPQGRPVLMQAGSSGRGRDFAVKHAEVLFSIQMTPKAMRRYADDIRERARQAGRRPGDVKIIFGVQPIVAETEEAARAKQAALRQRMVLDAALARLSGAFGADLSKLDLDKPLGEMKVEGLQGIFEMFTKLSDEPITLREAAIRWGTSIGMPQVVGTPEQVADQLQYLYEAGGGDGFNVTPTYAPGSYLEFVEMVVPILQRRGLFRKEYAGKTFREHLMES